MFFENLAYAMPPQAEGGAGGNPLAAFMPLILMFAIFYFLLIRPQQKKAKQHKEMLSALGKGDYVITGGGIYGRIIDVKDDVLHVEISDNTVIKVNRGFISSTAEPGAAKVEKKEKNK